MCGVFGYIGDLDQDIAIRCLDTLAHRGPDGHGVFRQPGITLGHRRLAILDLSDMGRQPMSYADGRFHITFNGEIYNFLELRAELERSGHSFVSESDTEVLLAAFGAWGPKCLDRFNGMWSFAIWDTRDRTLFLARDRLGKKPLFYSQLPSGDFAFASEMKALFPLLGNIRPNVALIRDTARVFRYEATPECVIEGISRFPAGHYGWWKEGTLSLKRWWCTLDHLSPVPDRYEEQVEQFRELFVDSCRLRMRSDVPIGTALSGGLDSSATISTMAHLGRQASGARIGQDWQHAFVAAFPGTPLDETAYARMVTEHLEVPATIIDIDPMRALERLDDYFYTFEDLYITSPIPFMLTYEAVKAHGISVTLDGHGADELFGGYPSDFLFALRDARWNLRAAYEIVDTHFAGWPRDSSQFAGLPSRTRFLGEYHLRHIARKLLRRPPSLFGQDLDHPAWGRLDRMTRQLYVTTHTTILPTLLRNYDRYSMANGVEIRMPFLDHRLLTFAFSLPWSSKIRRGYSKAIVRDGLSNYMPHSVAYRRNKIGFNSPIVDWMKGPLRQYVLDAVASRSFRDSDLIDQAVVSATVKKVLDDPQARFTDGERAWTALAPFLWERAVVKRERATI